MPDTIGARLKHAYNAFFNREPAEEYRPVGPGSSSYSRPDRPRLRSSNERSIISSAYTRMAIDVASLPIRHVRLDEEGRYSEDVNSFLNYALTEETNLDQTPFFFIQDAVLSMFDEGCVAIIPVETTANPKLSGQYDVISMRTGKIVEWFPQDVRVNVYNERTGKHEELTLPKRMVAIVENPLYAVMNEPNSTLKRLIRKLNILDAIDEQSGSGKLDIIIQLPYVVKSPARKAQAEDRRKDIELQLAGSKYGIAYIDGTERITQLNRPAENNLMAQIQYLTSMLYSQLGITEDVFTGTADEQTMLNYNNRTVYIILNAIIKEMKRKFLTKTARTQGQSILYFRDVFALVPADKLSEIADSYTRNEVLSSNEIRAAIGYKPSKDANADLLKNKNMPDETAPAGAEMGQGGLTSENVMSLIEEFIGGLESDIDGIIGGG